MPFANPNEEKLYKKWLKESPFNQTTQRIFGDILPSQEESLEIFRQERDRAKAKKFLPFNQVFATALIAKLPKEMSEEQNQYLAALTWNFIISKIETMNTALEKCYDMLEADKGDEAVIQLKELADAGHPEACYLLAALTVNGKVVKRDPQTAHDYAMKALEFVDHPRACLILAGIFHEGFLGETDRRQAVSWVLKAERTAEADPAVYPLLAEYYQDGYIVNRDVEKTAHYAHKGA